MPQHYSVLLPESLELLNIRPDGKYLDCTAGLGGHTRAIAARLSEDGLVIANDRDPRSMFAPSAGNRPADMPRSIDLSNIFGMMPEPAPAPTARPTDPIPPTPLAAGARIGALAIAAGLPDLRLLADHLLALPYGRPEDRRDLTAPLLEGRGSCSSIFALLRVPTMKTRRRCCGTPWSAASVRCGAMA